MKKEHILVIRFSAMGDVAMTVPVIYSLAKQYPDVRITMLSQKFARPFFEHMPHNVGFMEADIKNEYHGVKGLNALYRRLMAKNFTAIADLHSVLRSQYLRMRFNIDRYKVAHIDKHRTERRQITSVEHKILRQLKTSFQNYTEVFEQLGYPIEIKFKSIFQDGGGNLSELPETFRNKAEGEKWIGVAPFAAHKGKIYPAKTMEETLNILANKHTDAKFFMFGGGEKETSIMSQWHANNPRFINASAELNGISDELILMNNIDVMISMDSSNMHMASLVNTPVVSIWGATHPYAGFMGWNQDTDNAVMIDLPCRPCSIYGNKPCMRENFPCLTGITPQMIVDRVEIQLLKGKNIR